MATKKSSRRGQTASRATKPKAGTPKPAPGRRRQAAATRSHTVSAGREPVTVRSAPPTAAAQEPPGEIAEALAFPASARTIDRFVSAVLGRISLGISPAGLMTAYFEWLSHLVASPGKQIELMQKGARKASRFVVQAARAATERREFEARF